MRGERVIRAVLVVALALAAVGAAVEAVVSIRTVAEKGGRSWRASEIDVVQQQHLDPAVITRMAAVMPRTASYTVTFAPRLGTSVYGQAFVALLLARLLPRLQIPGVEGRWHVVWGEAVPSCCHVWNVGRIYPGAPPVMVVEDD
jgi:hypothetical protein